MTYVRWLALAIAMGVVHGGAASAQYAPYPTDPAAPATEPGATTDPAAVEEPAPEPVPEPEPAAAPPAAPEPAEPTLTEEHVPGRAVGIGIGYTFPGTDIDAPNAIGVRFRLNDRLAFEPIVNIEYSNRKVEDDLLLETTTESQMDVGFGISARYALATAGFAQFLFIGGAGFGYAKTLDVEDPLVDPDVDVMSFNLNYGLGIELFFKTRWSVSFDALNPFLQMLWRKEVYPPTGDEVTDRSVTVGAVWAPELRVLVSIYFAGE